MCVLNLLAKCGNLAICFEGSSISGTARNLNKLAEINKTMLSNVTSTIKAGNHHDRG